MALIVCCACERQRIIEKVKQLNYTCSNCGARNALIITRGNLWASRCEKSGKNKIEAFIDTYAGLKKIAEFKKFNQKYPLAKFRAIFGKWPPPEISEVPAAAPSKALLKWIEKSNKVWGELKKAEENKKAPEVVLRLPAQGGSKASLWTPSFMTEEDWEVKL